MPSWSGIGVAVRAVELYQAWAVPRLVFIGANAPTTVERFPCGEAVHYRDYAVEHGVPAEAIVIETEATNTAENFTLTRKLLEQRGEHVHTAVLISRPYQERRAHATCRKLWPERMALFAEAGYAISSES